MRTTRTVLGLIATLSLAAACAGAPAPDGSGDRPGSGGDGGGSAGEDIAPDSELAAFTTILQNGDDEPELCLAGVMESYPPQCGGPVVVGLDWDDVADAETASGVTWGTAWVVGTYDTQARVFTLTAPVTADPPDGAADVGAGDPGPGSAAPSSDASEDDLLAAQEAVHTQLGDDALTSAPVDGVLQVGVVLADAATVQAVHDAVEPWLTPDQVRVTGVLVPLG